MSTDTNNMTLIPQSPMIAFRLAMVEIAEATNMPWMKQLALSVQGDDDVRLEAVAVVAVRALWAVHHGKGEPCPAFGCQTHPRLAEFYRVDGPSAEY